jgi:maleate isomerase
MGTNPNYGDHAKIGIIIPSGNITAEPQLQALLPPGVSIHTTRLKLIGSSSEQLLQMVENVEDAALLLADVRPDLIVFHCTAVSTWNPEMDTTICRRIEHVTGIQAITTASSLVQALRTLDVQRTVLITPYKDDINRREVAFLQHHGIHTSKVIGLGIDHPGDMHAVDPSEWQRLVLENQASDAHAYFISCTAVRSLEVIQTLEDSIGLPVITSNQVMLWHALRSVQITVPIPGFGKLLLL